MPEKIRINLEYARNASVLNDLRIIFGTVGHLIGRTRATYVLFVP